MSKTIRTHRCALAASLSILVLAMFATPSMAAGETPGETFPASLSATGTFPETGVFQEVDISADGRHVAFLSSSPDLDSEATAWAQAYVKDLDTGALTLASRGEGVDGPPANEPLEASIGVERPRLSADGRYLAFESLADNLVAGMPATSELPRHVYRRDLQTGETVLVDRVTGPSGTIIPVDGRLLAISRDGRYVVFSDLAEDLEDLGGAHAEANETIYVRDLDEGTTTAVDRASGPEGALADAGAEEGAISADGRYVLFTSASTNLDPEANGVYQVYRRDLASGQTLLVSRSAPTGLAPSGEPADGESFEATFVGDSDCRVAFLGASATNLDPGAGSPPFGIYLRDFCASPPTTKLISLRQGGEPFEEAVSPIAAGGGIGFEGANPFPETRHFYLWDPANEGIAVLDRASGAEGEPSDSEVQWNAIAANGCRAVFTSAATNLAPEGTVPTGTTQAYVRQLGSCAQPESEASSSVPPTTAASGDRRPGPPAPARPPTRLRIVRLNRRALLLSFSAAGTAAVEIRGLVATPHPHWKLVERLVERAGEAGRIRLELPRLGPGRYRIRVRLRGSAKRALVRALRIEQGRHSNTLRVR
jgi:hypothetical protein